MASKPDKEKGKEKDKHELIIIRRLEEEEHETHNTAWKVAHADFMTAMMAFFLIMWLINVTDEETRKGISAYFNPVHLSAAQKGLADEAKPTSTETVKGKPDPVAEPKPKATSAAAAKGQADQPVQTPEPAGKNLGKAEGRAGDAGVGKMDMNLGGIGKSGTGISDPQSAPTEASAAIRERAAFHDPYAVLDKLAAAYSAVRPGSNDAVVGDDRPPGLAAGPAERDPFDPVYWQTTPNEAYKTVRPGDAGKAPQIPAGSVDVTASPTPVEPPPPPLTPAAVAQPPLPLPPPAASDKPAQKIADTAQVAGDGAALDPVAVTRKAAREIDVEVRQSLGPDLGGSPAPHLKVEATDDGVVISLTDGADFSMFDIGSAIPNGKVVFILGRIADMLAKRPGPIVIRGFTDARPFRSDLYDNWRLSAERAHMAYYMLVRGGLDAGRVSRIEGYADRSLKNDKDPNAAENRRIEILLRRQTS